MSICRIKNSFLLLLLVVQTAVVSAAQPVPVEDFFKKMAGVQTLSTDFLQEQFISGLKNPIRMTGSFYMTNKGNIAWIVKQPIRFYCIIYKEKLSSWDAESGSKKTIDLKDHPAFLTMVTMMKDFFAGKIQLQKDYASTLISSCRIRLRPLKHNPLAGNVSQIEILLSADRRTISFVEIGFSNGDRNVMRFKNIAVDKEIPRKVWSTGENR